MPKFSFTSGFHDWEDDEFGLRPHGPSLTPAQRNALRKSMAKYFNNEFYKEIINHFVRTAFSVDQIEHAEDLDNQWLIHIWKDGEKFTAVITREALSKDGLSAVSKAIIKALHDKVAFELKTFDDEDWIKLMNLPVEETKKLMEALKRG